MTGRSDSEKVDPDRGNNSGRLLFAAVLVFAVLATLTLVFTDSTKWLKLAVIAALWAAFFGAMLGVKYRHQAANREGEVADLQAVYELELEREVAARREYELEVEAETRRRLAEDSRDEAREDIAALRTELRALRENLDRLTGGEVLVERIALRAQSTRMRTIGSPSANASAIAAEEDIRRSITAGPAHPIAQPAGRVTSRSVGAVLDPSTELLEPVPPPRRREAPQRVGAPRRVEAAQRLGTAEATQYRGPARNQANRAGAIVVAMDGRDGPGDQSSQALRMPSRPDNGDTSVRIDRPNRVDSRFDLDDDHAEPWLDRADSAQRPAPLRHDPVEERTGQQRRPEPGRVPAPSTGEQNRTNVRREPVGPPSARPPVGPTSNSMMARSAGNADPASAPTRYAAPVPRPGSPNTAAGSGSKANPTPSSGSRTGAQAASHSPSSPQPDGRAARAAGDGPMHRPPADQPSRHSSPVEPPAQPAALAQPRADLPPSGTRQGGRRRAEESADWTQEPESWSEEPAWQPEGSHRGRHGGAHDGGARYGDVDHDDADYDSGHHDSGSREPVAATSSASTGYAGSGGTRSSGRRAEPEPAGAHTAGRSVTELLAAHTSAEDSPRRHRRRAE
jgi:hypothetical protein